ncbi:uncharacterized protein EV420DRAFT_254207 [Desarmillaria tabescens]|uniref:Uncharacterized protein n=1 Tax=Armillaria tabescens TaxID=1929756 RepID=A0AA39KIX2_ARMTA|nr:uncharacterized protein EV420DRAFT_254207 [Desarmillaria tabescens]KAK0460168.1 hypothetical protein EV420DRAFT_254207 [Desarmillaria tabescens]
MVSPSPFHFLPVAHNLDMLKFHEAVSLLEVLRSKTLSIGHGQRHSSYDLYKFALTPPIKLPGVAFDNLHIINPHEQTFSDPYFERLLYLVSGRIKTAVWFTAVSLISHKGRIWSPGLRFYNVTVLSLFQVDCTEAQYYGIIDSFPNLQGLAVSEMSIPNYLERVGEIANLSGQNTPEEIKESQTGPALQFLAVDLNISVTVSYCLCSLVDSLLLELVL